MCSWGVRRVSVTELGFGDGCRRGAGSFASGLFSSGANVLVVLAQQYLFEVPQGLGWDTLARELGKSKPTIRKIISQLERDGYLSYVQRKPLVVQLSELAVTKIFGEQKSIA